MSDPNAGNNGKILRLDHGGLYARRELSPEEHLEREARTWAARGKALDGKRYASRAVADIAQTIRHPHRIPARIIREALEGGATPRWAREFGELLIAYADRKAKALGLTDDERGRAA